MESLCNGYPMKFGRSFLSKPNDLCVHRSFSKKKKKSDYCQILFFAKSESFVRRSLALSADPSIVV